MALARDTSDPAFDLLQGSRSLTAIPLFENGAVSGIVVALNSTPCAYGTDDLCALAMVTSLPGRAIETQTLANHLVETCRTLDSELEAVAVVQRWLLPPSTPVVANTGIDISFRTASRSGGDYYDMGELPDGRVGVLMADVSGKGAAAMLMAVLRTIVHELGLERMTRRAALLDYADSRLCTLGLAERGVFVTTFFCALDPASGTLTYSFAGHDPPRLLRARTRAVSALRAPTCSPRTVAARNEGASLRDTASL